MIGANEDVMDARRNELANDCEDALAVADEVFELRVAAVENRLRGERVAFVEVQKRLMGRIVREESRGDGHRSGSPGRQVTRAPPNGLPVLQRLVRRPGGVAQQATRGTDWPTIYTLPLRDDDASVCRAGALRERESATRTAVGITFQITGSCFSLLNTPSWDPRSNTLKITDLLD